MSNEADEVQRLMTAALGRKVTIGEIVADLAEARRLAVDAWPSTRAAIVARRGAAAGGDADRVFRRALKDIDQALQLARHIAESEARKP